MKNIKRILAVAMVVILIAMYIWAFVASFLAKPNAGGIFNAAIFCTVFFPILLYVYMWTAKWLKGRGVDKDTKDKKNTENK